MRIVDEKEWSDKVTVNQRSVFFDPTFLNSLKSSFSYELYYYIKERNDQLAFAAAIFSKGNNVVVPLAFTYASIYFDEKLSDAKRVADFEEFVVLLQSKFNRISLRLGPNITDLRPLIWKGFQVVNRYTYIKHSGSDVHPSVQKKFRSAAHKDFSFKVQKIDYPQALKYVESAIKYGFLREQLESYATFFKSLSDQGTLMELTCSKESRPMCSQIVLLDRPRKMLFTLLIDGGTDESARMFLYGQIFNWSKAESLEQIDLCGANDKGIAEFKSYFNGVLMRYHLVSFNPRRHQINTYWQQFKRTLKILRNGA